MGLAGYRELTSVSILEGGAQHFPHVHTFFRDTGLTMVGYHLDPSGCGMRSEMPRSEAYLCTVHKDTGTTIMCVAMTRHCGGIAECCLCGDPAPSPRL